ncbi:FHA domain-containing protein [Campylobacter sp. CCS1377]|uniref:FHA domain-containing protein n=1 Tax=Campylobacter sp. CCS1377 TaxID=3158229 RepID=A0AAU7E3N9_9BACT
MTMEEIKLGIIIENYEDCKSQRKAEVFDTKGGIIGSGSDCAFCVQDKLGQIKSAHAKISYEEGCFTLSPIEDSEIFYNGSFSKMASGYETMVNQGDIFKIGDIKFCFVDAKSVEEHLKEDKKQLQDIPKHKEFDELIIKPRGQVSIEFNEKKELQDIITNNNNYDFIEKEKSDIEVLKEFNQKDPNQMDYENILKSLTKMFKDLKSKQKSAKLNTEYSSLHIKDLESIMANIPLVKSTQLLNLVAISLIAKELYSPIFEEMQENMFIKYFEAALQNNIKEDKILFENLLMKALEKYMKDF